MPPQELKLRRQAILDTAAALFARKSVRGTTIREIASELGVLSSCLYRYFDSKESMVYEVLAAFFDDLLARCREVLTSDADARTRLYGLIRASLEVGQRHPHAIGIYVNEVNSLSSSGRIAELGAKAHEVQLVWLAVINAGIAEGLFREDLDPRIAYQLIRDALWPSARWFKQTRGYSVARLADDCTALFLHGVAAKGRHTSAEPQRRSRPRHR